ncbi:hypothetical protein, partial [Mastigocoleus sp. MO_188.B34]|uniref:hypothetical protein n=1 Tax=Mastigocoleus sp. MO_188.B34 TaxID=3036635 RepID=UPI00260AE5F8
RLKSGSIKDLGFKKKGTGKKKEQLFSVALGLKNFDTKIRGTPQTRIIYYFPLYNGNIAQQLKYY